MANCPNCHKEINSEVQQCPACNADFTSEDGWRPLEKGEKWTGSSNKKRPRRLKPYVPNYIPYETRMTALVLLALMIVYVGVSLYVGKMYIPSKRGPSMFFAGWPLAFGVIAALFAALNLIGTLLDHLDTRDNEIDYQVIHLYTKIGAWGFFLLAFLGSCGSPKHY